jgi:hypothetical protein
MNEPVKVQGRLLSPEQILDIGQLIAAYPQWSRRRLSEQLCARWDWRNPGGQLKDMATRSLLLKLDQRGLITLPPRRRVPTSRMSQQRLPNLCLDQSPIGGSLKQLGPLQIREVSQDRSGRELFGSALAQFHYLGYGGTVGENLQYLVTDAAERPLGCVLFGSAAWKCAARDQWIGWTAEQRESRLRLITNNSRFLILPWVVVKHLASWILGQVARRIAQDWQSKYGHRVVLLETFVDRERFAGTCYRAANWVEAGSTCGRSRQDRHRTLQVPTKGVWLLPLEKNFRQRLQDETA